MPTSYTFTVRAVDSTAPTPQTVDKTFTLTVDFKARLAIGMSTIGGTFRLLQAPSYSVQPTGNVLANADEWLNGDAVAVSKDGSLIALVIQSSGRLVVLNGTGGLVHTQYLLGAADRPVVGAALAFNPAGTRLLVGYTDPSDLGYLEELNTSTWATTQIRSTGGSAEQWHILGYSPSGTQIAAGFREVGVSEDTAFLYVLDATNINAAPITSKNLGGSQGGVKSLDWSPDGSFLAASVGVPTLYVYETTGWVAQNTGVTFPSSLVAVRFSPDANYLLCVTTTEAYPLDMGVWTISNPLVRLPASADTAVWFPDATGYIITTSVSPFITFWNLNTAGRLNQSISLPAAARINALAISDAI